MQPSQVSSSNSLIRLLPAQTFDALRPGFERIELNRGQIIGEPAKPIRYIYFPEGGVISIVAAVSETRPTEVGMIGSEGLAGYLALLGSNTSPFTTMVQVDGSTSLRIEAGEFLSATATDPVLRELCLKFVHTMILQISLSMISHAHYHMEARLARWLLMCSDRCGNDDLHLTHDFLSIMLGSQRSSVTVTLHVLEGLGAIRSTRGIVTITNREKLEELAGETYGPAEADYRRLIGSFSASRT